MGNAPIAPGEVVYLLAEVRAGDRIHEIGTSALVVAADASSLTLELGGSDTISCRRERVAPVRRTGTRARRSAAAFRPATA